MKKQVGKNIKILRYLCLITIVSLGLLAIVGTGGGGGDGDDATTTTTISTTTTTIVSSYGSLQIVNSTSRTISEVYFSPTTSTTWGNEQLSGTISSGSTWTLTDIPPDSYDLKVVFSDTSDLTGSQVIDYSAATITAGETVTITLTDSNITGSLEITNSSSKTITEVNVSPTTSSTWGVDQLSGTISSGSTWTLTDIPPGNYDLRVTYSDSTITTEMGVTITGNQIYPWTIS